MKAILTFKMIKIMIFNQGFELDGILKKNRSFSFSILFFPFFKLADYLIFFSIDEIIHSAFKVLDLII